MDLRIDPWNAVFLAGFVVYVAIRGRFESRTAANEKILSLRDGREIILLVLVGIGNVLLPALYLFTPLLSFADRPLPRWAPWCGTVVLCAALWLFHRSHADLDRNWSKTLELRKGHQLVTTGVYRRVRHPMYAAIFLFGLAQALLLANRLAGWSAFVTFAVMYLFRTPREERMMREHFGEAYRAYALRTGRLLPRLRAPRERPTSG